jgi:hypothetical protein
MKRQAEDELRAIIDNAPVFLWSDLPDGYCDFLNQPVNRLPNLTRDWSAPLGPDSLRLVI